MATLIPGRETGYLKKGLCGLVQAGRTWSEELGSHVKGEGFPAMLKDPAVFVKRRRAWMLGGAGWTICWERPWEGTRHIFEGYQHDVEYR